MAIAIANRERSETSVECRELTALRDTKSEKISIRDLSRRQEIRPMDLAGVADADIIRPELVPRISLELCQQSHCLAGGSRRVWVFRIAYDSNKAVFCDRAGRPMKSSFAFEPSVRHIVADV